MKLYKVDHNCKENPVSAPEYFLAKEETIELKSIGAWDINHAFLIAITKELDIDYISLNIYKTEFVRLMIAEGYKIA